MLNKVFIFSAVKGNGGTSFGQFVEVIFIRPGNNPNSLIPILNSIILANLYFIFDKTKKYF